MSKLGRNDPCHCGSGLKYKRCCQAKDELARLGSAETPRPEPSPAPATDWQSPGPDIMKGQPQAAATGGESPSPRLPGSPLDDRGPQRVRLMSMVPDNKPEGLDDHDDDVFEVSPGEYFDRMILMLEEPCIQDFLVSQEQFDDVVYRLGVPPQEDKKRMRAYARRAIRRLFSHDRRKQLIAVLSDHLRDLWDQGLIQDVWVVNDNLRKLRFHQSREPAPLLELMYETALVEWFRLRQQEMAEMEALAPPPPDAPGLKDVAEKLGVCPDTGRSDAEESAEKAAPDDEYAGDIEEMDQKSEQYLADHPMLRMHIENFFEEGVDEVINFIRTDEGQFLLLPEDESLVWVPEWAKHFMEARGKQGKNKLNRKTFLMQPEVDFPALVKASAWMAKELFTEERRQQLQEQMLARLGQVNQEDKKIVRIVSVAALAAGSPEPPEKNRFLVMLCACSVSRVILNSGKGASEERKAQENDTTPSA